MLYESVLFSIYLWFLTTVNRPLILKHCVCFSSFSSWEWDAIFEERFGFFLFCFNMEIGVDFFLDVFVSCCMSVSHSVLWTFSDCFLLNFSYGGMLTVEMVESHCCLIEIAPFMCMAFGWFLLVWFSFCIRLDLHCLCNYFWILFMKRCHLGVVIVDGTVYYCSCTNLIWSRYLF